MGHPTTFGKAVGFINNLSKGCWITKVVGFHESGLLGHPATFGKVVGFINNLCKGCWILKVVGPFIRMPENVL